MATDEEDSATLVNTDSKTPGTHIDHSKVLSVDDEAVKDRWSRYIGAMGIEAVAK